MEDGPAFGLCKVVGSPFVCLEARWHDLQKGWLVSRAYCPLLLELVRNSCCRAHAL